MCSFCDDSQNSPLVFCHIISYYRKKQLSFL